MAETDKEKQQTYKDRLKKYMGQERIGVGGGGGRYKIGRQSLSGDQCSVSLKRRLRKNNRQRLIE